MSATFGTTELDSLEYDAASRTHIARFDTSTTEASMAVVAALSDVMDVGPTEMEPLGSTIDTDALDSLIGHCGASDGDVSATFTLDDHDLTVSTDGTITVAERDPDAGRNA